MTSGYIYCLSNPAYHSNMFKVGMIWKDNRKPEDRAKELQGLKDQQEQAKALFIKLQGAIEYLEGKINQENADSKEKVVGKKKK